jgi:hypothetical protein
MNEQIRQLLREAQILAREQVKNTPELAKYAPSYAIPGTEIHVGLRLSYEKFAELIVQKCVGIVAERKDQAIDEAWNIDEAMSASMFAIEDYFGAER